VLARRSRRRCGAACARRSTRRRALRGARAVHAARARRAARALRKQRVFRLGPSLAFFGPAAHVCRAASRPRPAALRSAAELPAALRPAVAVAVGNALLAAPALAEPGKIFDFNLTLPLMAGQFLLLMIILDKLVYTPVGKVLDDRDAVLRSKLEAVKDNSSDLLKFTVRAGVA
jgi:hypothetical protein